MLLYVAAGTLGGVIKAGTRPAVPDTQVLLLPGPIHTDIVLPLTAQVRRAFGFLAQAGQPILDPQSAWLVVGWGAHDFYTRTGTASDFRLVPALKAISGDSAVMRVELGAAQWDTSALSRVPLSASQFTTLIGAIRAGFSSQQALDLPGLTAWDTFYPANGRFNLLRTCNVWAGDMLRQAGARVGIWTPFTWTLP